MAARLAAGLSRLGARFVAEPQVNMIFLSLDGDQIAALHEAGLLFYELAPGTARFVTSWQTTEDDIDAALGRFSEVLA